MTAAFNPYLGLTYADLCGRRKDYAKLLQAAQAARKAAERNLTLICQAMAAQPPEPEYEASDHAVVRYLERVHGMDILAVRDLIRAQCAAAKPFAGNGLRTGGGHIYCVNNEGMVTTVLPIGAVMDELERDLVKPARSGDKKRARRAKMAVLRDSDGSGEAGETALAGSTEGDSAGRSEAEVSPNHD